jgi:hypothetical protein
MLVTAPVAMVAVAVGSTPFAPTAEKTTVGAAVYPVPPAVTLIDAVPEATPVWRMALANVAVAAAPAPPPPVNETVGALV